MNAKDRRKPQLNMFKMFIMLALAVSVFIVETSVTHASIEEVTLDPYYEVDNVYSTYSPSTNYTIGGGMYTSKGGLAVRPVTTTQVEAGLTLPIDLTVVVGAQTAIVVDIMLHTNMTRTMKLDVVESDTTVKSMQNTTSAYTSKNNQVVTTFVVSNNGFNNNLNASSGYATKNVETAYNQVVVPLTSYGYTIGETVNLSAINLYAPPWSTGIYNKYVLSSVQLTEDFDVSSPFQSQVIWDAQTDAYDLYKNASGNLDVRYLEPGQLWMSPSLNSSQTGIVQELVFKFPDALINANGLVDTTNLKGLTLEFLNETATNFNGHFKLYDGEGTSIANSNYTNLKTQKVTKNGTIANSNAKYFYPNTNTVGYADAFVLYNFRTTSAVTSESTESFYSPAGTLPAEISPYFTFTYDNNQSLVVDAVYLGTIRILTDDIAVYENTAVSDEAVEISAAKGYLGNEVTFKAQTGGRTVDHATLNETLLSETEVASLFSDEGLSVSMSGNMTLSVFFEGVEPWTVTFYDDDGVTVLGTAFVNPGESAIPPSDPVKASTAQYSYTFSGWDQSYDVVTEDMDIYATYQETINQYTVTFYDEDGMTVLGTSTVDYGTAAVAPADPEKAATEAFTYTFAGWDGSFDVVTEDLSVQATYQETINQYTVTFMDEDGETVLGTSTVDYGTAAVAPADPTKEDTTYLTFVFFGWDDPFDQITHDITVKAIYTVALLNQSNLIAPGVDVITTDDQWIDAGILLTDDGISYDVSGEINPESQGSYQMLYHVEYDEQPLTTYVRYVHVINPLPDVVITLNPDVTTIVKDSAYEDAGATTSLGDIVTSGTVDPTTPGIYVLQYTVTIDEMTFTKTKIVTVIETIDDLELKTNQAALLFDRKELFDV